MIRTLGRYAGIISIFLLTFSSLRAQWVKIGPVEGYYGLSTDPQGLYLYAQTGNGIIRSSDLGLNWEPLLPGMAVLTFINDSEVITGSKGGIFFKSMHYGEHSDSIGTLAKSITALCWSGNELIAGTMSSGFFLSRDTAQTWMPIDSGFPMPDGMTVISISALTVNDGYVYAGTSYPFGGAEGVIRSKLGSFIWQRTGAGFAGINVTGFTSIGPIVFAATYDFESGDGAGIYRSTDSGATWQEAGAPSPYVGVTSLTYLKPYLISGHDNFGVFISTDSGGSWWQSPGIPAYPNSEGTDVDGVAVEQGYVFAGIEGTAVGLYRRPLSDLAGVKQAAALSQDSVQLLFHGPILTATSPSLIRSFSLCDILGRTLLKTEASGTSLDLNCESLPNGVYFVRIETDAGVVVRKIAL